MSCDFCDNIERLKKTRKGEFKGEYLPSSNENQIVYDPEEKMFRIMG